MRAPDIDGQAGRGWDLTPEGHATNVAFWLLHIPGANIAWQWYTVSGVHLRDVEGMPPAKRHFQEATHEILVFAVNPEAGPPPLDPERIPLLSPQNICQQFNLPDDEAMAKLVRLSSIAFVRGMESPDTDFRSRTERALAATAEHLAQGYHDVDGHGLH